MAEITNAEIENLGRAPKETTTDEGTVKERSVKELIAAQNHAAANSHNGPLHGLIINRGKPGGAA